MESSVEHFFIKSELSIVSYFHRHFYWWLACPQRTSPTSSRLSPCTGEQLEPEMRLFRYANNLWANDMKCPAKVVLSEKDDIVPVAAVHEYLLPTNVTAQNS